MSGALVDELVALGYPREAASEIAARLAGVVAGVALREVDAAVGRLVSIEVRFVGTRPFSVTATESGRGAAFVWDSSRRVKA